MPQFFKGDAKELQMYNSAAPMAEALSLEKSLFFEDAYNCFELGSLLYDTGRAPLSNAIPRGIFREFFSTLFDAFLEAGTFESYLTVFRQIFGDEVEVTFTVPGPGQLNIDIVATGFELSRWVARSIVDNSYIYDPVVDHEGNNIVFQTIKGFQSQYELEQMLYEMVPAGIFTQISLTVGGP